MKQSDTSLDYNFGKQDNSQASQKCRFEVRIVLLNYLNPVHDTQ